LYVLIAKYTPWVIYKIFLRFEGRGMETVKIAQ